MWTKQQRQRHDFDDSSANCQAPKTKSTFEYNESWEEQAFAEDAAGRLGGCVWPPRSYSCSFCRREFRSAQALGGHMNVHRRDRARLKQSPNPQIIPFTPTLGFRFPPSDHQLCTTTLPYDHVPTHPGFRSDELDRPPARSDLRISCPRVRDKDHVEAGVSDEGLNFGFRQPRPDDDGRDEAGADAGCKRRKTDDEKSIQFYVKSGSLVERHHLHHHDHNHHVQSEVIGLSSSSLHDVDLELRLGGLSKR